MWTGQMQFAMSRWRQASDRQLPSQSQRASQRSNTTTSSEFVPRKRALLGSKLLNSIANSIQRSTSRFSVSASHTEPTTHRNSADAILDRSQSSKQPISYSHEQLLNCTTGELIGGDQKLMCSLADLFAPGNSARASASGRFREHMQRSLIGRLAVRSRFAALSPSDLVFSTGRTSAHLRHCDAVLTVTRGHDENGPTASMYLFQLDQRTRVQRVAYVEDIRLDSIVSERDDPSVDDVLISTLALIVWWRELRNRRLVLVVGRWTDGQHAEEFNALAARCLTDYQVLTMKRPRPDASPPAEAAMLGRVLACTERPVECRLDNRHLTQLRRIKFPWYMEALTCACCKFAPESS